FSGNQFTQDDDPDVGNRVYLVSESGSELVCPVHRDQSTKLQIICYTPSGLTEQRHYVKVVVDGKTVSNDELCGGNPTDDDCSFEAPFGTLYSDRYGSNVGSATNGRTEKLLRVYVGPQDCALKEGDEFYGLALEDENSNKGTLICKHRGSSIGFYNTSYIIDSPYGRSMANSQIYRMSYNDQIYLFQTYTNITSLSHSSGSTTGGLRLRIHGSFVDNRAPYAQPRAYIGDTECVVTDVVVDQYVECEVAADPGYTQTSFHGNRGVNFEYWMSTTKSASDLDSILDLTSSSANYVSDWLDETYHNDLNDTMDNYVSRMTTYFTAPHTGEYQFLLNADDGARLYIDGVAEVTSSMSEAGSRRLTLTKGQRSLLQVVHYENNGGSFVHVRVKFFDTKFTSAWTSKAEQEQQTISITSTVTYDVQRLDFFTFGNQSATQEVQTVTLETGGEFRFGLFGVYTAPLSLEADDKTISDALNDLPVLSSEESITLVRETTETPTYTLTFVSDRGDFPNIEVVKVLNSSDVAYTVTEEVQGRPDLHTIAIAMDGVVSSPVSVATVDQNKISTLMSSLFEAKCPPVFSGPGISKYFQDFESHSDLYSGTRVKDTEPFCGRYVLQNPSTTWYYTCVNVYKAVYEAYPLDTSHRMTEIWVYKVNRLRLAPARPNGALMDEVTVTVVSGTQYDITLKPYECGDKFPLFELAHAEVTAGRISYPSNRVTYALDNGGGSGVMKVSRSGTASPPVTGLIDITFNGKTRTGLNVSLESFDFDKELESLEGIGALSVEKEGTCAKFDLKLSARGLQGNNAAGAVSTDVNGGLYYDPLSGDFLTTVHDAPQVRLYINDVPTTCDTDCSFSWDAALVPTVTTVSPSTGTLALGTSVTISGTGFSSNQSDNSVTIGGVACSVTAATSTSITCSVGNGPVGTYPVVVNIAGKGYASGSIEFTYTADVTGISPASSSLGGGVVLTVTGYGFKSDATITINSNDCGVLSVTTDTVTCTVPRSATAGTFDVVVTQGTSPLSYSGFTYDPSATPTITDLSTSTLTAEGGSLTITGSSFGSEGIVYLGDTEAIVTSWSDSSIEVTVEVVEAGDLDLVVHTADGVAVNSAGEIPVVTVDLHVTNVYPLKSSLQGGTRLTLTGSGFGENSANLEVSVGDSTCDIETVSDSEIVCLVAKGGKIHHVTNKGIDPAYGVFYAFDKPYLTVNVGDFVLWSWETPDFVNNVAHAIIQVDSPSSTYQFTEVGVFYVWSDFVDEWGIKNYAGTIEVVEASASTAKVSVLRAGIEAVYNVGEGEAGYFNFQLLPCSTASVTSINVNQGTANAEIVITGNGFSTILCRNEVTFGGIVCDVISATATELTCKLAKSGEPELGIYHPLGVRISNRGNALVAIMSAKDQGFAVIPNIESISPVSGSTAGGAMLTITGFGFGDSPIVKVGDFECLIVESSYSEIICETPTSVQAQRDVTVEIMVNGAPLAAECETATQTCRYSYANLWTPTVTNISPDAISSTASLTITGTGLGTDISAVEVTFGGVLGTVTAVSDTSLTVSVDNIPAGSNDVIVRLSAHGKASGSLSVTGTPVISSITPASGSIHGNTTVTIAGNGFVDGDTIVTFEGTACEIVSTTLSEVVCITPANSAGSSDVAVTSNSESYPTATFSYATGSTPSVSSVSPPRGLPGDTLTISGSNLADGSVTLNDVECDVTSSSGSQIQCTLGNHATGTVPVVVFVDGLGVSNSDVSFEYQLSLSSISPTTGGTAGGQHLVLSGTGFTEDAIVTVCSLPCTHVTSDTLSYTCRTPANSADAYTYNAALTPTISDVTPTKGGTGGGTTITISGSGFGSDVGAVSVMINGSECVVSAVVDTASPDHTWALLMLRWRSRWMGMGLQKRQVQAHQTTATSTCGPLNLHGVVVRYHRRGRGKLIFDEKDIELQSKIIMITDGGVLQVGTKEEPFQNKAIITLHGHHRDRELPIYGTKVLAVRNGTLDLHGIEVPLTWTRLASTANAGSDSITLVDPVEWNVGDEIVIATTGHHHTQSENEKRTIESISSDKRTLTLTESLEATHVGTTETFDGTEVEFRAEVGLLTHNVVVRGNENPEWEDEIEACEAGFNTGEFATQTCFQGRFGDEIGSSQFGAMILIHAPVVDTREAQARISYVEVTFAGQAFRLGRYPIHFHLNGDMSTSYVRGCGIHKTFNRAVNIHGTHNTLVEKTVIYNIMGGAFFLEDGIETNNTIQYNLAVFVRESSSLLNDDVTPASFWVTNPNNIIQHNAAAGGSHFGYWYRMHSHPDGPSFTPDVCPDNVPLGRFYNNTAHSFGWFGLWVFEFYFPLQGGCGGTEVEPAVFEGLFAWNCEKGAESVNVGALQFKDFVLVQNKLAGYEGKKINNVPLWTDDSPLIKDSLIVGKTTVIPDSEQGCTKGGLVYPYGRGFRAINTRFVNFADSECATFRWTRISGTCSLFCGGYTYHNEQLRFINAPNKAIFAWEWEGIILDKDGTTTGKDPGWTILPTTGTLPSDCEVAQEFSIGINASVCPPQYKWHRFAFNNIVPTSLEGKDFVITNEYGTSNVPFAKKRLSHKPGWQCALLKGATYMFSFENGDHFKNISFTGQFYDFDSDDYLFMRASVETIPDRFSVDNGASFINMTEGSIDPNTAENGDWEWDNVNKEIKYIVHGRTRSKRGMSTYSVDRVYGFTAYKCFYEDCIPPPDPDTIPPTTSRPADFDYWNDATMWNVTDDDYVTNVGGITGTLIIEGVLEFNNLAEAVYNLEADYIVIRGGRLIIGWPEDPFLGLVTITLRGNHDSSYFTPGDGPVLGSKAIGVFGGLDLFGKDVGLTWTQLATTVMPGSSSLTLAQSVNWTAGNDIVLGTTTFNAWETESFRITAVSDDGLTLTLNDTVRYRHVAYEETLTTGQQLNLAAGVGLLSHNIRVVGEDYSELYTESFGARVLVGLITHQSQTYTGYARLSNVEFYHTGQEGWTEEYDPRFSVSFVATGTVSNVKPSKVTRCSFHNGFNTAVGAFGIGSLEVSNNVVFGTVGNGMVTSSNDTHLLNNLVTLMIATNAYQDRIEEFNPRWEAGIEAMKSTNLVMHDNLVTGSERVAYHVPPIACDDYSGSYSNNKAFGNMHGVVLLPVDKPEFESGACVKFANFTVWKNHDYGMYYQNGFNFVAENNAFIENQNGLITFVLGPSAVSHQKADKTVDVIDNLFVGQTNAFDCDKDVQPDLDDNYMLAVKARPSLAPDGGMVGLIFPNFYQKSNNAPGKPWKGCMAYNSIGGLMRMSGNTFAKYETGCKENFAVSTNVGNDDGQHPVESSGVTFADVPHSNKIVYHRPNKALFKDLDGTFLGHIGSVIPQSEYEWDGDSRRGLGDYRIPKEMVTTLDGKRIPVKDIAPNKGVIRSENCEYQSSWQAYECGDDLEYEMLIIENMDSDTELRRLSPVAVLGDGYIDLINGPQDHGWCSGYTCRKRLSTFMALVATDHEFLIHFTSTTPEHLRYYLLNSEPDDAVKLSIWYSRPNRLDLFVDGTFVISTNAEIDENGYYKTIMPTGNELDPNVANATGTNFFDKNSGLFTFIIKGPQKIDVITQQTVIVSFGIPALTIEQFFGDNIVENLANFLNIPLTKVRFVNVISASGRRRRSTGGISVEIEIGNEPSSDMNSTVSDSVSVNDLLSFASDIVNECQVGNLSASFNLSGSCEMVQLSSDDPDSPVITYTPQTPDYLFFHTNLVPEYEGVPLSVQPLIRVADTSDVVITDLGTAEHPWELTVSLQEGTGHASANLSGTLTVLATNGWFNFTDLTISHMGSGYILVFNVTYPVGANFTVNTDPFDLDSRPLKVTVADQTSGNIVPESDFFLTVDIRDENTDKVLSDINWRDHTWTGEVSMLKASEYGDLGGAVATTFDPASSQAMFMGLNMSGYGVFYVQIHVVSDPPDYDLTVNHKLNIMNPAHVGLVVEETYELSVFTLYANMWPDVRLSVGSIYEGSIVVTFIVEGSLSDVNDTAYSLCTSIEDKTIYNINNYDIQLSEYMTINNQTFYGVSCGSITEDEEDSSLSVWVIALIAGIAALILAAIVCVVIWRLMVKPKAKTHDVRDWKKNDNMVVEDLPYSDEKLGVDPYLGPSNTFLGEDKGRWSPFSVRIQSPEVPLEGSSPERTMTPVEHELPASRWPRTKIMALKAMKPKWRF
ncbi:PKHL1-like protein, partial [Mya arenaria]